MCKTFIFSAVVFFISAASFGQKSAKEEKGDKYFEIYSFLKAIEKYEQVKGLTVEGQRNLAESYKNAGLNDKSENTYAGFITSSEVKSEDLFNYASVLRLNGKYEQSNQWMQKFQQSEPKDARGQNYVKDALALKNIQKDEGRYIITHLGINTEQQDFGPAYYLDNHVVFASSREGVKSIKRYYNWNGMPFLDIYSAEIELGELVNPKQFYNKFNQKMHEGPVSFNGKGDLMVFTRNNYEGKSSDGTVKLQLFFSTKDEEGNWSKEEAFKLNSSEYSVGHACLSADGNSMYFASNMPGGRGGVDLYFIQKDAEGKWGEAINLGDTINTEGNEMFPFYHEETRILFFASNGHLGLGGLDVFLSLNAGEASYVKVLNAGSPLNTRFDDFGFIVDEKMKRGYFTSNREGGNGDDDIYAFELLKQFTFGKLIHGTAKNTEGNILAGVKIELLDNEGNVKGTVITGEDGTYEFTVEPDHDFRLNGSKEKYISNNTVVSSSTNKDEILVDVVLDADPGLGIYALIQDNKTGDALSGVKITVLDNFTGEKEEFVTTELGSFLMPLMNKSLNDSVSYNITMEKEGYFTKVATYNEEFTVPGIYNLHEIIDLNLDPEVKDLSEMVQINPINFDFNKYNIRPDAAIELDKIVDIMNKYPEMEVELGSHTDSRGSADYNEKLSDRRAKASAAYIKEKITFPERIYGKGYGESKIINKCVDGVPCSDDEHEVNRRTEFKVISTGNGKAKVNNTSTNSFETNEGEAK